jgi:cytochrome c551/c552
MERIQSISSEAQEDLRIVSHLDMQKLPESLQQMLSLASMPEEQDILLMATLAAASACVPNLYFTYGPTGKKYYANLQCFILAAAASGKGIAGQALEMVRVLDEQYPMLISGDSTLPAWYKALAQQNGCGYMHESEGSVITDIWKSSAANYNTALRKAAEHEPISRNRCNGSSEIQSPRLSMLLTGTFNQYRALVPSVENGYFSRLLTVVIRGTNPFDKHYVSSKGGQSVIPRQVGHRLLRTYETLMTAGEREWSLTDAQKERLGEHLQTEYATLISLLGDNFHSAVIRMAVQIERIAMILTAMRQSPSVMSELNSDAHSTSPLRSVSSDVLLCSDYDYATAELIGNRLLLHMAAAYRLIDGDAQDLIPDIKPLDQRRVLFNLLKPRYAHKDLVAEAQAHGISPRTAFRWNEKWLHEGLIEKAEYGVYQKVG